jgi:hypothetical protein
MRGGAYDIEEGPPVVMEPQEALSRPVCWTIELHTDEVAEDGVVLAGTKSLREQTAPDACNGLPIYGCNFCCSADS